MNLGRRLSVLENVIQPASHALTTDDDRRWYLGLCDASFVTVIWRFARYLAERRYTYAVGLDSSYCDDWNQATTGGERDRLVQNEIDRLRAMAMQDDDQDRVLTQWVETADREEWPALRGLTFSMMREGFDSLLHTTRQSIDASRGADIPVNAEWRRQHSEWRPGMSGDEATAFELALGEEADCLYDEWFSEVPA